MDDSTSKQLIIEFDNTVITNEDLFDQSLTLEESLCSESELRFGSCEASVLKFKVANIVTPMKNKWITAKMVLEGHNDTPFVIGKYKVIEDEVTADRQWREIVAYDALHDIINADATEVAAWYNSLLPDKDDWITMRSFRTSFMRHFGIEQKEIKLVNDYAKVERTIEPSEMSGLDIITAICEINGCFGHIGRDGKFHYIYLPQAIQGLYPANDLCPDHAPDYLPWQQRTGHLYPQDPKGTKIGGNGTYIGQPKYSDFLCKTIDKLQIRQEENDIGVIVGRDGNNCYIIEDNFLVYGKGSEELCAIANNILSKITTITYRPFNAEAKGNLCLEVGDPIRLNTKYELIESYILQRTLKGIQALRDSYVAEGVETYKERVIGIHKSIIQLKGKSNILERTIEETRLEMTDIEAGLKNEISITAEGLQANITAETERAEGEEKKLSNNIKITAEGLQANIEAEVIRAGEAETKLSASIEATAEKLTSEITEKTQAWDTGDYEISFSGFGEPNIPVRPGDYYLDTKTGAIYVGVHSSPREGWTYVANYKFDATNDIYVIGNMFKDGYGAPKVLEKPLGQYGYVDEDNPPLNENEGDVWLQPFYQMTVRYYVYELAHPAEWRIVGYAELETVPEMSSRITQTAKSIELKVSKGDVTSQLLIEPTDIYLKTGRLRIETDNLEINKDGKSGEILSRNLSKDGITLATARYIKLNSGGLEGGYGNTTKCKIECSNSGLAFRGARMTFCMDSIYVGTSMNASRTIKAYTGDIAYVAPANGDVTKLNAAVLHIWNGLVLDNSDYS